jgi:hypothetical protein
MVLETPEQYRSWLWITFVKTLVSVDHGLDRVALANTILSDFPALIACPRFANGIRQTSRQVVRILRPHKDTIRHAFQCLRVAAYICSDHGETRGQLFEQCIENPSSCEAMTPKSIAESSMGTFFVGPSGLSFAPPHLRRDLRKLVATHVLQNSLRKYKVDACCRNIPIRLSVG